MPGEDGDDVEEPAVKFGVLARGRGGLTVDGPVIGGSAHVVLLIVVLCCRIQAGLPGASF
jgi:hypothetical protein